MGERVKGMLAIAVFLALWLLFFIVVAPRPAQSNGGWTHYTYYAPPKWKEAHVKVVFGTIEQTRVLCSGAAGCVKGTQNEKGVWVGVPVVYAPYPQSFNDHFALTILGHEVLHVLGAYHD